MYWFKKYKLPYKIILYKKKETIKNEKPHGNLSDSPSSTLGVREMIRTEVQTCKGTHLSFFKFFFNKMASIAESIMAFVMLHNTGIKCE